MSRYVVLLKFTQEGVAHIKKSPERAASFRAVAEKAGAKIEGQYWTLGPYDAVFVLSAPDEATATALVLDLGTRGNVSTCMLRAFDADEFNKVLAKT